MQHEYRDRNEELETAMTGLVVVPAGRSIRHYRHRRANGGSEYVVGYVWQRKGADPYVGAAYDAILGRGKDFDSALANAIKRETAKRARLEAKCKTAQP